MATRTQARESVIGLLYAFDMGNTDAHKGADEIFEDKKIRNKQKEFAQELFDGVIANLEIIDEKIKEKLNARGLDDVGMVEKAILRLATYELLYKDLDEPIIINEAIELAKRLTSDNSPKFINGVLDHIRGTK
jgi:N utilization substance protein B